ncbi:MAG: enoyl-CoA hydratase-related protein [Wenzhouxiangellaceae bacterium]
MNTQPIRVERSEPLAVVTIQRPEKLNALNRATIAALAEAFHTLDADPAIRAIVIHGSGGKAFVAGADISEFQSLDAREAEAFSLEGQALMRRIERMSKPVIAAIDGYALGGGLELALACHMRLASPGSKLGLPEIKLGLLPGFGGTQRLPRLIGRGPALVMMLSGEPIDARRADALGLLECIDEQADVLEVALERAGRLASAAPLAVQAILVSVDSGLDLPLDAALAMESARFGLLMSSADAREGTQAFLERRPPRFTGH